MPKIVLSSVAVFMVYSLVGVASPEPPKPKYVSTPVKQEVVVPVAAVVLTPEQIKKEADAKAKQKVEEEKAEKKFKKELIASYKKEGVELGMTAERVLQSSWGKPTKINRTTNAYGSREQWVYRQYENGYLYFNNGILTSISN